MSEKKQIGKILLRQRALTPEQLDRALAEQKGERLASRLAADGTISDVAALKALSEQHGIPGIDLTQICLKLDDLELLPREIAEKHLILPVLVRDDRLFVAMANPREKKVIDELEFVTGKKVYPYVALETPLAATINEAYNRKTRGEEYFVGPSCPAETLRKFGIDPANIGRKSDSIVPGEAEFSDHSTSDPHEPIPLDVDLAADTQGGPDETSEELDDDALPHSSQETPGVTSTGSSAEVAYEDFGDLNSELSVVTDLPEQNPTNTANAATILVVDDEA